MKSLIKNLVLCGLAVVSLSSLATPVNINTADAKTIADALNGIGIKKAEAIVSYRKEKGLFKAAEDLLKVSGIGAKTVQKIKADILLEDVKLAPTSASETSKKIKP